MKTEKEKMIAGEMYDPFDKQLVEDRIQTRLLIKALNETKEDDTAERGRILRELIPNAASGLWLQPPFYVIMATICRWENECFSTSTALYWT